MKTFEYRISEDWRQANCAEEEFTPYRLLANAIVEQAVIDYREVVAELRECDDGLVDQHREELRMLRGFLSEWETGDRANDRRAVRAIAYRIASAVRRVDILYERKAECEEFFISDWFETLTKVKGREMLDRLSKTA